LDAIWSQLSAIGSQLSAVGSQWRTVGEQWSTFGRPRRWIQVNDIRYPADNGKLEYQTLQSFEPLITCSGNRREAAGMIRATGKNH